MVTLDNLEAEHVEAEPVVEALATEAPVAEALVAEALVTETEAGQEQKQPISKRSQTRSVEGPRASQSQGRNQNTW